VHKTDFITHKYAFHNIIFKFVSLLRGNMNINNTIKNLKMSYLGLSTMPCFIRSLV
jgi:hypothetical protein